MQILNFSVRNQVLDTQCPGRLVVAQTRGHLFAQFALDQEWDGLSVTAVFSNDFARQSYQRILTSDPVEVPEEVLVAGRLFVSLVGLGDGGALRLTTKCMDKPIVVYRAGELVGLAPDEATPELWEQLLAAMGSLADLKTSDKSSLVAAINEIFQSGGSGSVDPAAIAQAVEDYMAANPIQEIDPTVPDWAKEAEKPSYTAQEVGADPSGTAASLVAAHNTAEAAHNDIRLLISGLTDRLNALADSDDTTLDQLSEVVAYIKANRELIASITTDKVSVTDIVNNLATNVANKPLSAAQGVALKALIDAISIPDKLPNPNALTFTGAATGSYDGSKPLTVNVPSLTVDDSLTQSGQAADAAKVGEELRSLSGKKVSLPKDTDGNVIPGTVGWYAVSDGAGGITWVESVPSGGATTHGIVWYLVNVTSSNNSASVSDGASLVAVLTAADGYMLGDVTITMGGEVVTGAWNADTATITIPSVTGDVMISCAGVEQGASGSEDTSPNIQAYDTGWNGDGVATQTLTGTLGNTTGLCILSPYEFTLDVDALKSSGKYDATNEYLTAAGSAVKIFIYTPFTNYRAKAYGYSSLTNVTKAVFFADNNVLNSASNNSYTTDSPSVLTIQESRYLTAVLTASKLSFSCTLSTDDLDDSYAYFTKTLSGVMPVGVRDGDIIFAGKNTEYYGMANIDGTMLGGESATALSLDDDIAQDYGVSTLSLTPDLATDPSTVYGLSSAYASVLETIRDEWMIEYNGNANKIPVIIHTDQHGRMTNGGNAKGLFNTIGKAFSLHDISKVMNLGDTVSVEWADADIEHPLLSCTALENYLSTVEAIPFSKRLDVYGNHDTWYYNGYNDEGNTIGTRYPSTQNHLYKYFRNIYKKSNGNNTGYFSVCDDYFNVKYVVVSAYEYQNGTISDRMTSDQIEWIIREFSKDDGYDIVVVSHCPLYWDDTTGTFPEGAPSTTETLRIADDWIDALWAARKDKTSGTVNDSDGGSHTFDFTGCTSDLLCSLHGHTHRAGYNYVSGSLLSVAFDWFANESMYFCLIDRESRELKVWKFIGSDGDAPEYLTWEAPFDKA